MNPADWPEIERLFLEASPLTPPQRIQILNQASSPSIRAEVESLLAAEADCPAFLDSTPSLLAADFLAQNPSTLKEGEQVDRYQIESLISVGGMGEVYRAKDTHSQSTVALKLLRPNLTADPFAADRFEREAKAAGALTHPNIISTLQFGRSSVGLFIAMEWIEGKTWRELPSLPIATALNYARQAAQGLAAAHAAQIIHRDIKPENIMLSHKGEVKILDFGLARQNGPSQPDPEAIGFSGTISGTLSGTLSYMPPELLLGDLASSASDVFSLGSVLYELFTAHHPFAGETPLDIFEAIETSTPAPPSSHRPELPPALDALILSTLHRQPDLRPTSARLAAELEAIAV
jgi:eukaryotic-like serine/threonine-protein kinase